MRRSPAAVKELELTVLKELTTRPGQTRAELSTALGTPHHALDRPVINLVQSGRIARTGHKAESRYWPSTPSRPTMPATGSASAAS